MSRRRRRAARRRRDRRGARGGGVRGLAARQWRRVAGPRFRRRRSPCGEALGSGDLAGFARALGAPRRFRFPTITGRTRSSAPSGGTTRATSRPPPGRHVGFQLTFFRTALAPPDRGAAARASAWATRQLYLAHFALTDTAGGRFHAASRLSRAALGLGGARAQPVPRLARGLVRGERRAPAAFPCACAPPTATSPSTSSSRAASRWSSRATAASSREGARAGQRVLLLLASRACPRAAPCAWAASRSTVSGLGWMDREWSTSALGAGPGRLGLVRAPARRRPRRHGLPAPPPRRRADPHSAGTLVAADGSHAAARRAGDCDARGARSLDQPARAACATRAAGACAIPAADLRSRSRRGWPTRS